MNEREFKQRVLPLSGRLYSICHRMLGNQHEAKDCLQDVFIKLWTKRQSLSEVKSIEAYCFTITRNSCLDRLRLRKHTIDIENVADSDGSLIDSPEENHDDSRMYLLNKALTKLPELHQKVFNLRDIERLEFDEIAERMSTTPEHVRVLLSRARKKIKEIIEQELVRNRLAYE